MQSKSNGKAVEARMINTAAQEVTPLAQCLELADTILSAACQTQCSIQDESDGGMKTGQDILSVLVEGQRVQTGSGPRHFEEGLRSLNRK